MPVASDELPNSNPRFWVASRKGEMELAVHWAMMMGALGYLMGATDVVAGDSHDDEHEIPISKKIVIKYIAAYKRQLAKQMNARMTTGEPE